MVDFPALVNNIFFWPDKCSPADSIGNDPEEEWLKIQVFCAQIW